MILKTERPVLRSWSEIYAKSLYRYAKDSSVGVAAGWKPHKFGTLFYCRKVLVISEECYE